MGKEKQKKEKVKGAGFGLRLSVVIILWLIGIVLIIMGIWHIQNGFQDTAFLIICPGALSVIIGVLQLIAAVKGRTKIWANTMSIVIGSALCVAIIGIPALVGGVKGRKTLLKAETAVSKAAPRTVQSVNGREKVKGAGFGLRLSFAIILLISAVYCILLGVLLGASGATLIILLSEFVVMFIFGILQLIAAIKGKTKKWANTMSIVIGAVFCLAVLGVLAVVGGVKGRKALRLADGGIPLENQEPERPQVQAQIEQEAAAVEGGAEQGGLQEILNAYPVDYENKPTVSQALDLSNDKNLVLTDEYGTTVELRQLYICVHNGGLYLLAENAGENENGKGAVFCINYDADTFTIEKDDSICEVVYNKYTEAVSGNKYEQQKISRKDFKLDLYDSNIDEKSWKEFKKTASQEELAVIAIGAKYRVAHGRILNIIYAIGIILSIALFWPTGGYSLIGYPVFAFLATKAIRYEDTYGQSYRKLNKEYKALVDGYYNSNVGLTILDAIIKIAIFWITIPYQAILMLIGLVAPNFVISKNGILVSIPKGYDVGNLGEIGAYYSSFSFIDEMTDSVASTKSNDNKLTVNGKTVTEQPYVIDDRYQKVYKDDNGNEYVSDDGGKTVREYHRR